jgi:hypothetical protein
VEKTPRCGGDWCGVSMQRHGEYCMHKEHRDYKNVEQRRDGWWLLNGIDKRRRRQSAAE